MESSLQALQKTAAASFSSDLCAHVLHMLVLHNPMECAEKQSTPSVACSSLESFFHKQDDMVIVARMAGTILTHSLLLSVHSRALPSLIGQVRSDQSSRQSLIVLNVTFQICHVKVDAACTHMQIGFLTAWHCKAQVLYSTLTKDKSYHPGTRELDVGTLKSAKFGVPHRATSMTVQKKL